MTVKSAFFLSLSLVLLMIISSTCLRDMVWGLHHLYFVPDRLAAILALTLLCFAFTVWGKKCRCFLPGFPPPGWPRSLVLSLSCGIAFFLFRSSAAFLGDGNLLLNEIKDGSLLYPSNQADYLLHARLYLDVLSPLGFSPKAAYALLSALAGSAFVFLVLQKRHVLGERGDDGAFFLLTSGFMMVFFGYVESYAFHYLFVAGYLLFVLDMLCGRGTGRAVNIFLILAVLFHQTGVFLLPSYAFVLFACRERLPIKKVLFHFAAAAGCTALAAGLIFYLNGFTAFQYIAELKVRSVESPEGGLFLSLRKGPYAAFSAAHMLDLLNLFLLSSPLALLGLPFALRRRETADPAPAFLGIALASYASFFFFMDPKIGMFRDWDLFSVQALPLSLLFARAFARGEPGRIAVALLVGANVFSTASWVAVNHGAVSAVKRFERMAERAARTDHPGAVSHNFEEIARHYRETGDIGMERAYLKKALDRQENGRLVNNLAFNDLRSADTASAVLHFRRAVQLDPGLVSAYANLSRLFGIKGLLDSARIYASKGMALNPPDAQVNLILGASFHVAGVPDTAEICYLKALQKDPAQLQTLTNLFLVSCEMGDIGKAEKYYRQALSQGMARDDRFESLLERLSR